jgi:LPS sulfotransferase NodH
MGRHFILTNARSGSNFLTSTINMHPELLNFGEVLGEWTLPRRIISRRLIPKMSDEDYLDFLYRSRWVFYGGQVFSAARRVRRRKAFRLKLRSRIKSLGMKDFAYLIRDYGLGDYIERSDDIKVIQLLRSNTLKRFVSGERLRQTKIVSTEGVERKVRLEIDTETMLERLRRLKDQDSLSQEIVARLPRERVLELSYEDYFSSPQRTAEINADLFRFLDVEPISAVSGQKKIGSDRLDEIVRNYPEFCRTVSGTEFEGMLD